MTTEIDDSGLQFEEKETTGSNQTTTEDEDYTNTKSYKSHLVDTIRESKQALAKKMRENHYLSSLASAGEDEEAGSGLISGGRSGKGDPEKIKNSRAKIVNLANFLRKTANMMAIYSFVCLILKAIDFSNLSGRLSLFKVTPFFEQMQTEGLGEKYVSLYYEVNLLGLSAAVFAVGATVYINFTLLSSKVFSGRIYKKFITACMIVIFIFLTLCLYFLLHFIKLSGGKLLNWVKGARAIAKMSSDSAFRNCLEILLFALMFIGLYVLITVSNMIETEIRTLDILRGKNTKRNTELVSSSQAPYEI